MNTSNLKKHKDFAFGKDIYLIGKDSDGTNYWLEAPSFDCGWYWGFGYIETYTNNNAPSKSYDVDSHSHWDSMLNRGELPLAKMVVNETDFNTLKTLFTEFYSLKEKANKNVDKRNNINELLIPNITKKIIDILTP